MNVYSFSKDVSDWNDGTGSCELLYNNKIVCTAIINNYTSKIGIQKNTQITKVGFSTSFFDEIINADNTSFNGIFIGSTREKILQQLGKKFDVSRSIDNCYI